MNVSDAAEALAIQMCGCADARQRRADVAAILAYRDACIREGIEMAAKVAEEWFPGETASTYPKGGVVASIRALAGEVK